MSILPADVPVGLVTGQFYFATTDGTDADIAPDLNVVTGTVTFTCSAKVLKMPGKQSTIIPLVFNAAFDASGNLIPANGTGIGLDLPATDSAQFNPSGFTWHVDFNLRTASTGYSVNIPSFDIAVPAGTTVDLTAVMPVTASNGVAITQGPAGPQGIQGATGPQGPQGIQGVANSAVVIKGKVASSSALPTSGNTANDAYVTSDTNHLWAYISGAWSDVGPFQGPAGATGPTGPAGTTDYNQLTNVPTTFAPIIGTTATTAKAGNWAPAITDVTNLSTTLATKIPAWQANTAYTINQQVVSPNNDVVSAIAAHTSGASFTAANWTLSSTFATVPVAVQAVVVSTGSEARPSGPTTVIWKGGTTRPTNIAAGDIWLKAS